MGQLTFTPIPRNDVLLPVLAHTTLNGVPFTPKDSMGVHVKGDHCTARMGRLFVWAVVKVPISSGLIAQRSALSGSALSYAWLGAMNSALGSYASMAVNIQDFTVSATYLSPQIYFHRTSSGMLRTNKRKYLAISTALLTLRCPILGNTSNLSLYRLLSP